MMAPCYKCAKRALGCFTTCDDYNGYRNTLDMINARKRLSDGPNDVLARRINRRNNFLRKTNRQGGGYAQGRSK